MYLMHPETPREQYAELLVSRAAERVGHRVVRRQHRPLVRLRTAWRSLGQKVKRPRPFTQLAKG